MSTLDTQMRLVASISGVPLWFIETGNWRKNPEMIQKVRDAWPKVKGMTHYHYHVANKNVDEVASIIRRWYYTKVGRGNQALIAYDYIKLTGEKVSQNWAEHQAIGEKIDKLKRISEEIKCPVITAMQLNRTGENFNRNASQVTDDSSAISLSDRMQWFASFVGIFRRKTQDEIQTDGEQFGTHKLIAIKTRFQGREGTGHHDLVRRRTGENEFKYFNNYINFEVGNFNVEERGTLREIVDAENERLEFDQGGSNEDGELL
jgi:replicative DNA helicase